MTAAGLGSAPQLADGQATEKASSQCELCVKAGHLAASDPHPAPASGKQTVPPIGRTSGTVVLAAHPADSDSLENDIIGAIAGGIRPKPDRAKKETVSR